MAVDPLIIEDALLVALRQDSTLAAYLATIESYEGQFHEENAVDPNLLFPAVLVQYQNGRGRLLSNVDSEGDYRFSLYVAGVSYRGNAEIRHGTPESIGVLEMMLDLRKLLIGNFLGRTDMYPLFWAGDDLFINRTSLVVYICQYMTPYNTIPAGM